MRWTHWTLNPTLRVLEHREVEGGPRHAIVPTPLGVVDYEVDLDDALTSAQILDWIFQLAGKTWCGPWCLYGLVEALNVLVGQRVCSSGKDYPISIDDMTKSIRGLIEGK